MAAPDGSKKARMRTLIIVGPWTGGSRFASATSNVLLHALMPPLLKLAEIMQIAKSDLPSCECKIKYTCP